jgi:hypothetical protein
MPAAADAACPPLIDFLRFRHFRRRFSPFRLLTLSPPSFSRLAAAIFISLPPLRRRHTLSPLFSTAIAAFHCH